MIASISIAARDSRRVSVLSRVISQDRSPALPDRAARWKQTTALPAAAVPPAALPDLQSAPRHRLCVFPPGLPWLGLLLPLTRPADPARSSRRILVAADAFENTAERTAPAEAVRPRLPGPVPVPRRSWTQTPWPFGWDRRRS